MKIGNNATISLQSDESFKEKRFSIAHELGNLLMNHVESLKKICSEADMMNWYQTNIETQANFFASELILPTKLVNKRCDIGNISLIPKKDIAKDFRPSLTATAIKFVRWCPEKCAVVYLYDGKIRWSYRCGWRCLDRKQGS